MSHQNPLADWIVRLQGRTRLQVEEKEEALPQLLPAHRGALCRDQWLSIEPCERTVGQSSRSVDWTAC